MHEAFFLCLHLSQAPCTQPMELDARAEAAQTNACRNLTSAQERVHEPEHRQSAPPLVGTHLNETLKKLVHLYERTMQVKDACRLKKKKNSAALTKV